MLIDAVVMAAGKGTRMKSDLAKVLHPVAGRPLIAHVLATARAAGIGRIVVVVGHQRDAVRGRGRRARPRVRGAGTAARHRPRRDAGGAAAARGRLHGGPERRRAAA